MKNVIEIWIDEIQDAMPDELRDSAEWRELLPRAAGTGRELEAERLKIVMDWMWGTALPLVQPLADARGFGEKWREMCELRTFAAANAAYADAAYAGAHAAYAGAHAAYAGAHAADAAYAARYAAINAARYAAADDADDADATYAAYVAARVANAAARAANAAASSDDDDTYAAYAAARAAADAANVADVWAKLDPVGLLHRLVEAKGTPSRVNG